MEKLEYAYDEKGLPNEIVTEYEEEVGQVVREFVKRFQDETDINVMFAAIAIIARGIEFERALYTLYKRETDEV